MTETRLRILLVAPGHSIHTARWARFLNGRGHDIAVVSDTAMPDPPPATIVKRLPARSLPRTVRYLLGVASVRRFIREWEPDIVHVHSLGANVLLSLAVPSAQLVTTPWGSDVAQLPQKSLRGRLVGNALRRSRRVLTTSHQMSRLASERFRADPRRVRVISWGIDTTVFRPVSSMSERGAERRRWEIPADRFVVVSHRTTSATYRTSELVSAFQAAVARRPELHLVVIEGFNPDNARAREAQRAYIQAVKAAVEGVADHVTFVDGLLAPAEMASLLRAADAAVSIPAADSRSSSVLEAIASGVQVILADIPAYRELMDDGVRAIVVGEPIVDSLSRALAEIGPMSTEGALSNYQAMVTDESWPVLASKAVDEYEAVSRNDP